MSADNVTPIRPHESTKARPRRARPKPGLVLEDPPDGPCSMRVIQALHGVCQAAEQAADSRDQDLQLDLATAAEILSLMLKERISG